MMISFDPERDLTLSRVIRAPRARVWRAWTDPRRFEKWWLPAPGICRVLAFEPRPGGALRTEMSEDGIAAFTPHMDACFLAADEAHRIVFTNALVAGWRPALEPFMTAVITIADHPEGTEYRAHVMHRDAAVRAWHEEMGFAHGWGSVTTQLALLAENERSDA